MRFWPMGRGRGSTAPGAVLVLAAGLVVAPLAVGSAARPALAEPKADSSTEAGASRLAQARGSRVEVTGLRTETETTWANPDGSFTSEQSVVPLRVRTDDGAWVPVDADLERRADGSVGPRASTVDELAFSGGGTAPLVRIAEGGKGLSLRWPGRLPEPTLKGNVATYADVLPGVDLQLRAGALGFRQVLVVKTPEAARDPQLSDIRMRLQGRSVAVAKTPDGGLEAEDSAGKTVLSGERPRMWDSAGDETRLGHDGLGDEPGDRADGPAPGDRVAAMDLKVGADLTVTPDAAMLTSPRTRFPVYIDPPITKGAAKAAAVWIASNGVEDWNKDFDKYRTGHGIGRCGTTTKVGKTWVCTSPAYTARAYFAFDTSKWRGRVAHSVTFRVGQPHTFSCEAANVHLELVGSIRKSNGKPNTSLSWSKKPPYKNWRITRKIGPNNSHCDDKKNVGRMEFSDSRGKPLTDKVQYAMGHWRDITFGLRAEDEGETWDWKRVLNDAVLSISYNTRPNQPTGLKTSSPPTECRSGTGRPWINDRTPVLEATVTDKDNQSLKATFEYWSLDAPQTRKKLSGAMAAKGRASAQLPSLADGSYGWRVSSTDGVSGADGTSPVSATCEFTIDTTRPRAPLIKPAEGNPYTLDGAHGGPTTPGRFEFAAPDDASVADYEWSLNGAEAYEPDKVDANGVHYAEFEPGYAGFLRLFVRSYDKAHNQSTAAEYFFEVARPQCRDGSSDCPLSNGRWPLDKGAPGADTMDGSPRHPVTFTGATETDGAFGTAVRLSGNGSGGGTGRFPELRTDKSFTVSAWARLNALPKGDAIALSKVGTEQEGVEIGYSAERRSWFAAMNNPNDDGVDPQSVEGGEDSAEENLGQWTHLAVVYRAPKSEGEEGTLSLYVNGEEADFVSYTAPANAEGPLQLGRNVVAGKPVDTWAGDLDEVRVFQYALPDVEIAGLAGQ